MVSILKIFLSEINNNNILYVKEQETFWQKPLDQSNQTSSVASSRPVITSLRLSLIF